MAQGVFPPPSQTSGNVIAQFSSPLGLSLRQTITSSGAVTIPAGINYVYAVLVGGGGGGGGGGTSGASGGGGGGAYIYGWAKAAATCTIGAGGSGGASVTDGSTGGYTIYGGLIAGGGGGGGANSAKQFTDSGASGAGGGGGGGRAVTIKVGSRGSGGFLFGTPPPTNPSTNSLTG